MTPKESHSLIDAYLTLFHDSNVASDKLIRDHTLVLLRTYKFQMEEVLSLMKRFGMVEERNSLTGREFVMTALGYEVLRHGGWTKYLEEKDEERRLAKEQVKSSILTNRSQFWILLLTFFVAVASVVISWLNYKKETLKNEKGEEAHPVGKLPTSFDSVLHNIDSTKIKRK